MDSRIAPDVMTGWIYARNFLGELYECEYLADTWPERLGLDDLAALQTGGKDYPVFEAWNTCLRKAAESVELVTCKEFWWLSSDEPSEYWTRKKQRKILIPPCHKSQGDDILFFNGGALERDTVSPKDFAEYLKKHDKQPSKYILAWFGAYDVDIEPEPYSPLDTDKTSDKTEPNTYDKRKESFKKWIDNQTIDIEALTVTQIHSQIKQYYKPNKLWNITLGAFKREFWQTYSKEYGIKKKSGRPAKR